MVLNVEVVIQINNDLKEMIIENKSKLKDTALSVVDFNTFNNHIISFSVS